MKKIQKTVEKSITVYVADDGREFTNEQDCNNWEKSYEHTLEAGWNALRKLAISGADIGATTEYDDRECYVILPRSLEDITLINAYIERFTDAPGTLTQNHINQFMLFDFGYDRCYCDALPLDKYVDRINKSTAETKRRILDAEHKENDNG